uniref:YlxP-like protein n=1 Tax=Solibacter usitatus (strain Ellin6076) TaxID=234267 RepID=Q01W30_SOLUE
MASIGVLTLELRLESSHSLKEKRHVVASLKDRLRHKFNVSVAEIDHQDLWQRATLAAVTVASDHVHAEKVLLSVEEEAADHVGGALVSANVEWIE